MCMVVWCPTVEVWKIQVRELYKVKKKCMYLSIVHTWVWKNTSHFLSFWHHTEQLRKKYVKRYVIWPMPYPLPPPEVCILPYNFFVYFVEFPNIKTLRFLGNYGNYVYDGYNKQYVTINMKWNEGPLHRKPGDLYGELLV